MNSLLNSLTNGLLNSLTNSLLNSWVYRLMDVGSFYCKELQNDP